jgi:hypothetical protein
MDRTEPELDLLRRLWPDLRYESNGQWVLIADYALPEPWSPRSIAVAFQIPGGPPGSPPYAFYVRGEVSCGGCAPSSYTPVATGVPFPGTWGVFSWAPESWPWADEPAEGANMVSFARSFAARFAEGA